MMTVLLLFCGSRGWGSPQILVKREAKELEKPSTRLMKRFPGVVAEELFSTARLVADVEACSATMAHQCKLNARDSTQAVKDDIARIARPATCS
jgi:hypothetical protein